VLSIEAVAGHGTVILHLWWSIFDTEIQDMSAINFLCYIVPTESFFTKSWRRFALVWSSHDVMGWGCFCSSGFESWTINMNTTQMVSSFVFWALLWLQTFQLLEYQWQRGRFDKPTARAREHPSVYDWGNLNGYRYKWWQFAKLWVRAQNHWHLFFCSALPSTYSFPMIILERWGISLGCQ